MSFTQEELNAEGIRQWTIIESKYRSAPLLLGNGFSLNFSNSLKYSSLKDLFITECSQSSKELFERLETTNFEKVLEALEISEIVQEVLFKEKNEEIVKCKHEIRDGLIKCIHTMHPRPDQIDKALIQSIALQFKQFSKVFTTNYDLFLYYIILEASNFSDHFFERFDGKFNIFEKPDIIYSNHIYYLHGALFVFENGLRTMKLLKGSEKNLLHRITQEIDRENIPLFISEGKWESKKKSIDSNTYLRFCFEELKSSINRKLIIFGQSLSQEQDNHLIQLIDKNCKNVAISIHPQSWKSIGELSAEKSRINSYFSKTKVDFYDSNSLFNFDLDSNFSESISF